jgi:hypothetical protein
MVDYPFVSIAMPAWCNNLKKGPKRKHHQHDKTPIRVTIRETGAIMDVGMEAESFQWTKRSPSWLRSRNQWVWCLALVNIIIIGGVYYYYHSYRYQYSFYDSETPRIRNHSSSLKELVPVWIREFQSSKQMLETKLQQEYGEEHYRNIFYYNNNNNTDNNEPSFSSRARFLFTSGNMQSSISWNRLKRKLQIRILSLSTSLQKSKSHHHRLVWATGGHSATAGHGNFYDESYTAFLERSARIVFTSTLLATTTNKNNNKKHPFGFLEGRNYAMGATSSGPEISLCMDEIFGKDIDILVWDYGMTDGNYVDLLSLYCHRAGRNVGRPIILAYHAGGRAWVQRARIIQEMEDMGLAAMISSEQIMDEALAAIPDSLGLSDEYIQRLPPYVRNFRCGPQIESGQPYCGSQKYNDTMCADRKGKTNWHPGWKWHALMGNLAALFLVEALGEALHDLQQQQQNNNMITDDPETLLYELQSQENRDYEQFFQASVPLHLQTLLPESAREDFPIPAKVPTFCHTARLPAQIRYRGILTQSSKTGFWTYDAGMNVREAMHLSSSEQSSEGNNDQMILAYSPDERYECPVPFMIDYKDYFFVQKSDGWRHLVLPNDAELREYGGEESKPLQGFVTLCYPICGWGKCPPGNLDNRSSLKNGTLEIQINSVQVTTITEFLGCDVLKHANGYQFPANSNDRFDIRIRIADTAETGSFARFSSFILW